MPRSDVTEPAAVVSAMREYHALGADEFRRRYGFRPSRAYNLEHDGRVYDSKAIIGVARGIQHPELGPMAAREFSGGASNAAERLRRLGFLVRSNSSHTNPNWTVDELILALDVYLRHAPRLPAANHPDVVELSETLRKLAPEHPDETFRNLNGVHLKLANFAALDPDYPGRGSTNGGRATAQAWDTWSGRRGQLHAVARAIRRAVHDGIPVTSEPTEEEGGVPEGATLYRLHKQKERDRTLRRRKLAQARAATGHLVCEACESHLPDTYGPSAEEVVEVHHIVPLSESGEVEVRLRDLAVLCPNCHRVIHRTLSMTPFELRQLIETRRGRMAAAPLRHP